ncbi:autotransporter outer membrane beta-barrel domain-containing protein [Pseudomonas gingeri]|uniref:Autotransporter domain-containing protein n=1 Tax=Pseudomonas gingeri TaxID=117681 RepID=A0A7Y8BIL1_9PSED|nr:autotransporter outer membrane beta-barrel domain-containing protein [Pseudomonas gingeri]NWB44922.1 autotransporter domain-containing protein [Pseudomonas gingeri]
MPTTLHRLAISVALASSVIASQQAQASPQAPIYSRPNIPNANYLGATAEGGTLWEAPIGSGQQPPLSQYQQQGLGPNTYTVVGPHPIAHGVFWVKPNNENAAPFEAHIQADGSAVRVYVPDLPPLCPSCAPGQQPPFPQVTPVPLPTVTSTGIVETNRNNIAANTTAHQINASNIADLDKRVTGNTNAHQANTSKITDLDKRVTDNTTAHQTNASDIADHGEKITGNTNAHQANTRKITDLEKRVTDNTITGQANASDIADHGEKITGNTNAHQANTSKITDLDKRVTDNTITGQTNATAIAEHKNRVTANTSEIQRIEAENQAFRQEMRESNAQLEQKLVAAQTTNQPQRDDPKGNQGGNVSQPFPKPVDSPLRTALNKLGTAAKRDARMQLSGAGNASLGTATLSGASQVGNSALAAMRQLGNDPTQRQLAGQNGAPGQVSLSGRSEIRPNESRVWLQALNNASAFDQPAGQKAFEQDTRGLVVGVDWALDNEWRMGLLGGKSQSKHKANRFEGGLDSWHVGTYALHQSGPVALRLGAVHSQHYGKTERNVEFSGYKDRLTGNHNANSQQAFAELGYNLGSDSLSAEPFASLGYQRYSRQGYTEKGGEAALKADAQTQSNFSTTLGLRTASIKHMDNKMSLAPRLSAGWKHLYGSVESTSTQSNQVTGDIFNTKGITRDRDTLVVEAGLDLNLSARHSIGVAYNGEVGNSSRTHGVMGQWKMSF